MQVQYQRHCATVAGEGGFTKAAEEVVVRQGAVRRRV